MLDGFLLGTGERTVLAGPGDRIDPHGARWTACTPARIELGVERLPSRLITAPPGTAEERVVALLWRIARRWATVEHGALALPSGVDAGVLAALCAEPEERIGGILEGLLLARSDGRWLLPLPGRDRGRERGEEFSARIAEQFAISRLAMSTCQALVDQIVVGRSGVG